MSVAERLADKALNVIDKVRDGETQRVVTYIFEQAISGTRDEKDLLGLEASLNIHTRSL